MGVLRYDDASAFCEKALPYLLQREAENNLMIGIALRLADGTGRWGDAPPLLLLAEEQGNVVAAALQTPPHNLLMTRLEERTASMLADHLRSAGCVLPGVTGPEAAAEVFAALWARASTTVVHREKALRLYQLERVIAPRSPSGHADEAAPADAKQLVEWIGHFAATTDEASRMSERSIEEAIEKKRLWLWKDPAPVSLAAFCGPTPNGIRINLVYTPPEYRGRGYATTNVAALSQMLLDQGRTFCCLFADLANPTSNSIYQKIGYQQVCDFAQYRFAPAGGRMA